MAVVTLTISDSADMGLMVGINSNPPFPQSHILMTNAQVLAAQLIQQFEQLQKSMAKNEETAKLQQLIK